MRIKYNPIRRLNKMVSDLALSLEKMHLAEYMQYLNNTRSLLWKNFLTGVARGVGTAVGFTVLGALVIYILQRLAVSNVPGIANFISDIVEIVQRNSKIH